MRTLLEIRIPVRAQKSCVILNAPVSLMFFKCRYKSSVIKLVAIITQMSKSDIPCTSLNLYHTEKKNRPFYVQEVSLHRTQYT